MRRVPYLATFLVFVVVGFATDRAFRTEAQAAAQPPIISPGYQNQHGVSVAPTGVVRLDAWTCYHIAPGAPPGSATTVTCPSRVEFGAEVPDTTLVCRSNKLGQTCKQLAKIFP